MGQYQYYYGSDAENFNFFRLPKKLIRDKQFRTISSDAKILYGLLLDRMTLSQKNGWLDEEGRIYIIYTIEEIAEELYCSKRKAIQLMNELDIKDGIGLIRRKRQGMGRPNLIYVMNFNSSEEAAAVESEDSDLDRRNEENHQRRSATFQEVQKRALQEVQERAPQEVQECAPQEVQARAPQEVQECAPQKDTDMKDTDYIYNNLSIYLSETENGWMDRNTVIKILRKKLDYEYLVNDCPEDAAQITEIVELMGDICCQTADYVTVNGNQIPIGDIRQRMMSLNIEHIRYVLYCLKNNAGQIRNIRSYLLACLYNAPVTIRSYYQVAVQHDMVHQSG